jgi:hypothetical protein
MIRRQVNLDSSQTLPELSNLLPVLPQPPVGKEMPISRIVVAVPNATVVLLD